MLKVFVLGHKGMLGNAVYSYLNSRNVYILLTTEERFDSPTFREILKESGADVIINCIGIIPQKNPNPADYYKINSELPIFLETLGKKVVHPSTDCEFSGNIPTSECYKKDAFRDATDDYGKSKAEISKRIEESFRNTKIIRSSIIGHELTTHLSLLDWFLQSETIVNGYTNHYWNGITTLHWAKLCEEIFMNWDLYPTVNQYGTEMVSKYELLNEIKKIYNKDTTIVLFDSPQTFNKCLETDKKLPSITEQLVELKDFYQK